MPILFVFSPSLLLDGTLFELLHDAPTAIAGVWLVSIGIVGYYRRLLSVTVRLLFILAGFSLLIPAGALSGGIWTDVFGVGAAGLLLAREHVATRGRAPASAD